MVPDTRTTADQILLGEDFALDPRNYELRCGGRVLKLERIPMEVLLLLVEERGQLVTRDRIIERVWGKDVFLDTDNSINAAIRKIRQVLKDDPDKPRFVQTITGRGYRFIASTRLLPLPDTNNRQGTHQAKPVVSTRSPSPVQSPRRRPYLILALAAMVLAALAVSYYFLKPATANPPQTLAVLPFKPLAIGAGDESLELGMADALITKLSRSGRLVVRPTSAIRKYMGPESDPVAAGEALHVDAVLEGNIQHLGERLRVSLRLVRVRDGISLWSDSYDTKFTDVFQVQDTVSEQVAQALDVQLSGQEKAELRKHDTANVQAYELCMRGVFFWNKRSEDGLKKAIPYFEQAIVLDDNYALAHAGLAAALAPMGYLGYSAPDEVHAKMRAAATRAVSLDPRLPLAHVALGAVLAFYERNWSEGEKEFRRALELNPNLALAHLWYGELLDFRGRYEDALQQRQRAQELDPATPIIVSAVGETLFLLGDNERALAQFRTALEIDNSLDQAHVGIGQVYEQRGEYQRAIAEYRLAVQYAPGSRLAKAVLGHALGRAGANSEANQILNTLIITSRKQYVSPLHLAMIHAGLGDNGTALNLLERAYEQGDPALDGITVDPQFQRLHRHPRFVALLARMGLKTNP